MSFLSRALCYAKSYMPNDGAAVEFDFYPDVSDYPTESLFEIVLTLRDGSKAQLYHNTYEGGVDLHSKWMKQVGLDGVLLQRFLGATGDASFTTVRIRSCPLLYGTMVHVGSIDIWSVLNQVQAAAEKYGLGFVTSMMFAVATHHSVVSLMKFWPTINLISNHTRSLRLIFTRVESQSSWLSVWHTLRGCLTLLTPRTSQIG